MIHPDYRYLIQKLDLALPLIGVYDAPDPDMFKPVITPEPKQWACIFDFFEDWMSGRTLQLSIDNYGCGGCGHWWWGLETRNRKDFIDFLANKEGLKASEELMGQWIDSLTHYKPKHQYIFVGPLKEKYYDFLKTVTFYINPDQLSILITGAQYYHRAGEPSPVLSEFGSGCMEILSLMESSKGPGAIIGATDMAMRHNLQPNLLAFTVNKPMFENLCRLDSSTFLEKPFLKKLKKSRGGRL
jgi:hypothetical protein